MGVKQLGRGDLGNQNKNLAFAVGSLLLPPLAVFSKGGDLGETGLNLILWCLGVVPGVIHALLVTQTDYRLAPGCGCSSAMAMDRAPVTLMEEARKGKGASQPLLPSSSVAGGA